MSRKIRYHFELIKNLINSVNKQIDDSFFIPDHFVGISRGGCIPAVILSHQFNKPMTALNFSTRDFIYKDKVVCEQILNRIKNDEKVVIVDDICDSGETFNELLEVWKIQDNSFDRYKYPNLKFATIFKNHKCEFEVDYFGELSYDWIIFPWEE